MVARGAERAFSDEKGDDSAETNGKRSAAHHATCDLRLYVFPLDIEARKSWLVLVFDMRDSSSSIASTGDSGVSTLRRTQTRFRSSFGSRSSSFRVPLFWMSIDGNTRRSVSFRSRWISRLPVP